MVTMSILTGPAGATLLGTLTQPVVEGVATFDDSTLDTAGPGYVLQATSGTLTAATSIPFLIAPAAASQVAFTIQPTDVTAGATFSPAVTVSVEDAFGNLVADAPASVTLSLSAGPAGATLGGTLTEATVQGVATFGDTTLPLAGTGCVLEASSGTLASATSSPFNVTAGAATQLVFTTEPSSGATVGTALAPAVTVAIEDTEGNVVTSSSASVTVSLATNPTSAVLSGTLTQAAVNGVATFGDLSLQTAGIGYVLGAASPGVSGATSSPFTVTAGAADHLAFVTQPATIGAGAAFSPVVAVAIEDNFGNTVTTASAPITLSLATNPTNAALTGTLTQAAVNGVATFSGVGLQTAGAGYALMAASGTLTSATSNLFDVTPGAAAALVFTGQPMSTVAGVTLPAVTVAVEDAFGNTVTSATTPVTIALQRIRSVPRWGGRSPRRR